MSTSMPQLRIHVFGDDDDQPTHVTTIAAADVAHYLTMADEMVAGMDTPRDAVWSWVRRCLGDRALSERLITTLLWLACREPYTGEEMEAVLCQGGLLECRIREGRDEGLYIVTPAAETISASLRSGARH
jgi:hypothetical protein